MGLLSSSAITALENGSASYAYLAEFDFTTGVERYWTGNYTLSYDGHSWTGLAGIASVSDIESDDDITPKGLQLRVVGLPAESMRSNTLDDAAYKDRPARWIFLVLDSDNNNAVLHSKVMHYTIDLLDYAIINKLAGVAASLEHETVNAARATRRLYSDQDQKSEYAGDLGLQFLPYLNSGREVRWGISGKFFID